MCDSENESNVRGRAATLLSPMYKTTLTENGRQADRAAMRGLHGIIGWQSCHTSDCREVVAIPPNGRARIAPEIGRQSNTVRGSSFRRLVWPHWLAGKKHKTDRRKSIPLRLPRGSFNDPVKGLAALDSLLCVLVGSIQGVDTTFSTN
jgi:hypothetical protein